MILSLPLIPYSLVSSGLQYKGPHHQFQPVTRPHFVEQTESLGRVLPHSLNALTYLHLAWYHLPPLLLPWITCIHVLVQDQPTTRAWIPSSRTLTTTSFTINPTLSLLPYQVFPLFWIILGSMKMSFHLPCLRQNHQQTPSLESSNPHLALHFVTKFFSSLSTPMLSWTNPLYAFSPHHCRRQVFATVINEITLLNLQPVWGLLHSCLIRTTRGVGLGPPWWLRL